MQDSGLNPGLHSWEASTHQPNHTPLNIPIPLFFYMGIFPLCFYLLLLRLQIPLASRHWINILIYILVFMLIVKCISLIWICCRLGTDTSGTPVFCHAFFKSVWVQCWAMNSRIRPLLGAWLSLSLTFVRLVIGLTLDFPHLYCLPLDGGNLAFASQGCFLFLWLGYAKSLSSVLDLWTLPSSKKSGCSALVRGHSSTGRILSKSFA